MSLTKIVSNVFKPRQKELEKYLYDAEHLQHNVLMHLLEKGKNTEYGVKHLLNNTDSYEKFANRCCCNSLSYTRDYPSSDKNEFHLSLEKR